MHIYVCIYMYAYTYIAGYPFLQLTPHTTLGTLRFGSLDASASLRQSPLWWQLEGRSLDAGALLGGLRAWQLPCTSEDAELLLALVEEEAGEGEVGRTTREHLVAFLGNEVAMSRSAARVCLRSGDGKRCKAPPLFPQVHRPQARMSLPHSRTRGARSAANNNTRACRVAIHPPPRFGSHGRVPLDVRAAGGGRIPQRRQRGPLVEGGRRQGLSWPTAWADPPRGSVGQFGRFRSAG